jgi:hypothetical protein
MRELPSRGRPLANVSIGVKTTIPSSNAFLTYPLPGAIVRCVQTGVWALTVPRRLAGILPAKAGSKCHGIFFRGVLIYAPAMTRTSDPMAANREVRRESDGSPQGWTTCYCCHP